jgi:hypothetical protein
MTVHSLLTGNDSIFKLYDVASGLELRTFSPKAEIMGLAISSDDGKRWGEWRPHDLGPALWLLRKTISGTERAVHMCGLLA